MASYNYDYSPLSTGHKAVARNWRAWIWPALFTALLTIDLAVVVFYPRQYVNPLDNFQDLNDVPVVDLMAVPSISSTPNDHAVVSSLYTDAYATAVISLGHSLRVHNTTARMILIYLPDRISPRTLCLASAAGWTLHAVPYIAPPHDGKGIYGHFKDQYTKLNLWTLDAIGIKKVVYLDADTLVRQNFDELFSLPFNFAAVPDVFPGTGGFTTAFNAGVLFLRTSTDIFNDMKSKLEVAKYPPEYAEQAFLNLYFGAQAARLPYSYNANLAIKRRKPEMWKAMIDDIHIVHYTLVKPFPLSGDGWLEARELEDLFQKSRKAQGGYWVEEMSWWEDSWRDLASMNQVSLAACAS